MLWLATKLGFALILANIFVLFCTYGLGAQNGFVETLRQTLFALPFLIGFDLWRYGRDCWRRDCLAD